LSRILAASALVLSFVAVFAAPATADSAPTDSAGQCTASLAPDGKLHSGADAAKTADACLAAATGGNAQVYYLAGLVLEQGIGKPKDVSKAEDWYRKAANKGEVKAQLAMGRLAEARGKNDVAMGWYSRAALKNSRPAQEALLRLRTDDPYAMWDAAEFAIAIDDSLGRESDMAKSGSGIIIGDGVVLTNEHVVAGCSQMAVAPGLPARVLATDAEKDLAVIKTPIPLGEPVPLSAENTLAAEMDLYTGGYPGIGNAEPNFAMTTGRLSTRKIDSDDAANYWLLSNQINPGNSGGPLMDASGRVVGVVSAELPVTGIVKKTAPKKAKEGMAVRSEIVRGFLEKHSIAYKTAAKGPVADAAADMKHHAAAVTVLVECFVK
jgi:S1-C subfamily serine protease